MTTTTAEAPADPQPPAHRPRRMIRLLGLALGAALAVAGFLTWRAVGSSGPTQPVKIPVHWRRPVVSAAGLVDRSGIEIKQVATTAEGGLVDLRYRVIDPQKAGDLHDPGTPPAVVDEASGLVVHTLLMNHAHHGTFRAGQTYYLIFDNPGNWLHPGSRVAVLLGDSMVTDVIVQ